MMMGVLSISLLHKQTRIDAHKKYGSSLQTIPKSRRKFVAGGDTGETR